MEFRILIPVIPLPEKSQKNNAVSDLHLICSFALLTPQSVDVDGIIACQEVGNGALSKSTH